MNENDNIERRDLWRLSDGQVCLVLTIDSLLKYPAYKCAALLVKAFDLQNPFHVEIGEESGLPKSHWVMCDNPYTFEFDMFEEKLGYVPLRIMSKIETSLKRVLGLSR